jgi:hypothetical protein
LLAVVGVLVTAPAEAAPVTETFDYTGAAQEFTVPDGVHHIDVVACGAQGGPSSPFPPVFVSGEGGRGGRATGTIGVTPGESLWVYVGGWGATGGFNGGGSGGTGGGGGGASDVRQGGQALTDRVVIGGGGGGGGVLYQSSTGFALPLSGGAGGGLSGGSVTNATGGTQTGPGIGQTASRNGALGVGGPGLGGGGGGGGLYGGAGGPFQDVPLSLTVGAGAGGSGLGDSHQSGVCSFDGQVTLSYDADPPEITPFGAILFEGNSGTTTIQVPVFLSEPTTLPVTIDWATVNGASGTGLAASGSDFVAASGTVTFAPGDTTEYVPIEIIGDTIDEPALLYGEWGLITFSDPTHATLDTATFFGAGLFIIVDDD